MNKPYSIALVGASELSLTIALVVFVMLTILLLAVLLLLKISKNFRVFFFSEKRDEQKSEQELAKDVAKDVEKSDTAATDTPPKKAQTRRKKADFFDGVPTVPLTFIANEPEEKPRRRKAEIDKNGVLAASDSSEKATYTPRTIARDKSDAATDGKPAAKRRTRGK